MPTPNSSFKSDLLQISAAIVLFALINLIIVFLWIALTPKLPSFKVTSVTVTSLSTNTAAELSATFDVEGNLRNPNLLLSVHYESLRIALWFDHRAISSAPIEPLPFSTGPETDTALQARFLLVRTLFRSGVGKGVAVQRRLHGFVDFGVTFTARLRFKYGLRRTELRSLAVECYPLKVVFPDPNGNIHTNHTGRLLVPSQCYVVRWE